MADQPKYDRLQRKAIAADYGYALKVIYSNKEIRALFEQAVNAKDGLWTPTKFTAALMDTKWWKKNAGPAREAWAARQMGTNPDGSFTADYQDTLDMASSAVRQQAVAMGAQLDEEELDRLTQRYINEGWSDPRRSQEFMTELAAEIEATTGDVNTGGLMGGAGDFVESLRKTAEKNGLKLSEEYFIGAARSVASGLTTESDWDRDIRKQGASLWPGWEDKIVGGMDAYDLMSGYRTIMAQEFEVLPDTIGMDDPILRQAVTRLDEKGNPAPIGLWDFQTQLRQDPRWMDTKGAQDKMSNIGTDVLRLMGFM
jgi:hypothetical protein